MTTCPRCGGDIEVRIVMGFLAAFDTTGARHDCPIIRAEREEIARLFSQKDDAGVAGSAQGATTGNRNCGPSSQRPRGEQPRSAGDPREHEVRRKDASLQQERGRGRS